MSRLARLSPRERALVLVVLPLALAVGGWRLGWTPLLEAREAVRAEIATHRLVSEAAAGAEAPGPAAAAGPRPLAARVTASAEAAGLPLRRIEPEGERLRLTLEDAPFDDVVAWIAALEARHGAAAAAVEIERRIEPGTVSARLTIEAAR